MSSEDWENVWKREEESIGERKVKEEAHARDLKNSCSADHFDLKSRPTE